MSIKRLKKLLQALHLNDNSQMPGREDPAFDKLYKFRPVTSKLNHNFQNKATLTKSQSIDECITVSKVVRA